MQRRTCYHVTETEITYRGYDWQAYMGSYCNDTFKVIIRWILESVSYFTALLLMYVISFVLRRCAGNKGLFFFFCFFYPF